MEPSTPNEKLNEFKTLRTHVENPLKVDRALKHEIGFRAGNTGMTVEGIGYRPNYGSSADAGLAAQERKERRMRYGDWP